MNYQQWELEHAAANVAANTNPRQHDIGCKKICNCSVLTLAREAVKKSWEAKNL